MELAKQYDLKDRKINGINVPDGVIEKFIERFKKCQY